MDSERAEFLVGVGAASVGTLLGTALGVGIALGIVFSTNSARGEEWGKDTDPIRAGMIGTAYERGGPYAYANDPRPRAWCGWWLRHHFGIGDRRLNLAREWARIGHPVSHPSAGVIAVWRHHVGVITAVPGPGRIVLLSGNDGHAVRERERSTRGIIALRAI